MPPRLNRGSTDDHIYHRRRGSPERSTFNFLCLEDKVTAEQSTYTVTVTAAELTLLITSLSYQENRQLYLSNLAKTRGRTKEAEVRLESARTAVALCNRLYEIGAKEAP
jgi:hypothetical protein